MYRKGVMTRVRRALRDKGLTEDADALRDMFAERCSMVRTLREQVEQMKDTIDLLGEDKRKLEKEIERLENELRDRVEAHAHERNDLCRELNDARRESLDARNKVEHLRAELYDACEDARKLQKRIFNQGKALDNERARARQLGQELESEKAARTRDADYYLREWEPKRKPEDHGVPDSRRGVNMEVETDVDKWVPTNRPEDGAHVEGAPEALTTSPGAQWSRGFDQEAINTAAFTCSDKYLHEKLVRLAEDCPHLTPVQSALVAAAADRMGVNVWPGERQLRQRPTPKGDLAEALYPEHDGYRVDYAVPHNWVVSIYDALPDYLQEQVDEMGGLAAQFVTVYHDDPHLDGRVMPVTRMGIEILATLPLFN